MESGENGLIGPGDNNYGNTKKSALSKTLLENYVIKPKFKHGDTVYFFAKDRGIAQIEVSAIHALLRPDGGFVVFYSSNVKRKYKPEDVVEEALAFATPEEVGKKMVEKYRASVKEEQQKGFTTSA